jgi:hypothetical protein
MAFEKLRTIVITAIPKPRSRERFRKVAEKQPSSGELITARSVARVKGGSRTKLSTDADF